MPSVWNLWSSVFTSEIGCRIHIEEIARSLCGIEAPPHVRNVYIQVIHVLSAAGEAFVKLVCVVSWFSWIWVLIAGIIRPLVWHLQYSRFRVWLVHYYGCELDRQSSVLHYIPLYSVVYSLQIAALNKFSWTLNWELEIYVLPWPFPLLGLKYHSAFDKRSRVICVYNGWINRIYLYICENAHLIQHHILLRIICVFENRNSGVRYVCLDGV